MPKKGPSGWEAQWYSISIHCMCGAMGLIPGPQIQCILKIILGHISTLCSVVCRVCRRSFHHLFPSLSCHNSQGLHTCGRCGLEPHSIGLQGSSMVLLLIVGLSLGFSCGAVCGFFPAGNSAEASASWTGNLVLQASSQIGSLYSAAQRGLPLCTRA